MHRPAVITDEKLRLLKNCRQLPQRRSPRQVYGLSVYRGYNGLGDLLLAFAAYQNDPGVIFFQQLMSQKRIPFSGPSLQVCRRSRPR